MSCILSKNSTLKSTISKLSLARCIRHRFIMSSCRKNSKNVEITCSSLSSNVDQKVRLSIGGLNPNQKVTLRAKLCGETQDRYRSVAHYIADSEGKVCLSSQPSVGGSYIGIEPMGFIWALKPEPGQRPGRRLMKRNVESPYLVNIDVLDGHLDTNEEEKPLSSLTIERYYMGDGVRKIEVKDGRIRGSLFLPAGEGPFQGVIDILGYHGGLIEFKAALLASNGFAALSLAYFNYDDLPKLPQDVELEYFQEAVEWLQNHPQVIPGGVGVMGISYGACMALRLAANCDDVKATTWISGHHGLVICPIQHKGKPLEFYELKKSEVILREDGSMVCRNCYPEPYYQNHDKATPVENIKGQLLLVYGTDDQSLNSEYNAFKIYERMKKFGKEAQCSLIGYHGAGHLIEPPYSPHFEMSYQNVFDVYFNWGGETQAHANAQEHSWSGILRFFKECLPQKSAKDAKSQLKMLKTSFDS